MGARRRELPDVPCFLAGDRSHEQKGFHGAILRARRASIKKARQVFDMIKKYCPQKRVPAKTRFFVEELLP